MLKFERTPFAPDYIHLSDIVGFIPSFVSEQDDRPAAKQIDDAYNYGGGWRSFKGFTLGADNSIKYPGDPAHQPWAVAKFRDETIVVYESGWTAIIQPDRSFEIARLD